MSDPKRPDDGPKAKSPAPTSSKNDLARGDPKVAGPPQLPSPLIEKVADPLIGAVLSDRYRIDEKIGEGGMGRIYQGENIMLGKKVAIKVLQGDFAAKSDLAMRFVQEAKLATKVVHENIIDIIDLDLTPQGSPYYVMELLKGKDLAATLSTEGALDWQRVLNISVQVCRALGAAHSAGIVHRDMKPLNIFLVEREDNKDFVKVFDFGIAKVFESASEGSGGGSGNRVNTNSGTLMGTPAYMSPEQTLGKPVDHKSDIYAVGIIMYELLCGRPPFDHESVLRLLDMHRNDAPEPFASVRPDLAIPAEVEAIVMRALAKDASKRYDSIKDMEAEIASLMDRLASVDGKAESVRRAQVAVGSQNLTPLRLSPEHSSRSGMAYNEILRQDRRRFKKVLAIAAIIATVGAAVSTVKLFTFAERRFHVHKESVSVPYVKDGGSSGE